MSANYESLLPPDTPEEFESLCLDLWKELCSDPGAQKNGRRGQNQDGVDVFAQHEGKWVGVQCKRKDALLRSKVIPGELEQEVNAARKFEPKLGLFILATTGPRDASVQKRARELSDEHKHHGLFKVEVWSWEDIREQFTGHRELRRRILQKYYRHLREDLALEDPEPETKSIAAKVFISYSDQDKKWVQDWLLPRLENAGIQVHIDFRDFDVGVASVINMERAVEQCAKTIFILSPSWVESEFAQFECAMAQISDPMGLNKRMIPLMLQKCELPRRIRMLTYADFRNEGEREVQLERILNQIRTDIARLAPAKVEFPAIHKGRIDTTRLPKTRYQLFGRQDELERLREAWDSKKMNVVSLVAYGGTGKSVLVNKWLERMRWDNYRGAERVYGWSFFSQGTGQPVTSADQFISHALTWFGDSDPTKGSPWDKGERLATLVCKDRTLLVLDGLEPLQRGFGSDKGEIKDPALSVLVRQLAWANNGLCVITTRERVAELDHHPMTSQQIDLEQISKEAGRELLQADGVQGTDEELEAASEAFGNHALAVSLLAAYLQGIPGHHVSTATDIPDLDIPQAKGKDPRRVMEVFNSRFGDSPETQVLRIMGLFDRPADDQAIEAVKSPPPIPGLTDKLHDSTEGQWLHLVDELRDCRLLAPKNKHYPTIQDCHPLVREHFGEKLARENPDAWREAHRRLYEHLTKTTEHRPGTLAGLEPLYQAVAHGCLAGMHEEALYKVYVDRILRGTDGPDAVYSIKKLGAFGSDLAAVACFFERPWTVVSHRLSEAAQAWLLNQAFFSLRALGRLTEALGPMRAGLAMLVKDEDWKRAAQGASNLSELEVTLGRVDEAVQDAGRGVEYADRSGDAFWRMGLRTTRADALFQAGEEGKAAELFREAELMQAEDQPQYPLFYSLAGFRYCDLLLGSAERTAWKWIVVPKTKDPGLKTATAVCRAIKERANKALQIVLAGSRTLLDIGLNHLSLGRAALYEAILLKDSRPRTPDSRRESPESRLAEADCQLSEAVDGLRLAAQLDDLPRGLLCRALLRFVEGDADGCGADLDEAWQIAERGSMRLFMADVLLHRGRLFRDKAALAEARKLIEECGYHRRDGELADAEEALKDS